MQTGPSFIIFIISSTHHHHHQMGVVIQLHHHLQLRHLTSVIIIIIITCFFFMFSPSTSQLIRVGFYSRSCPNAERTVSSIVQQAVVANPSMAAILLRLHFHDCFVQGCDGSILIDGEKAEKHAFGHQGVGGFEVIEAAKAQLEKICPGVVSCADILAMAARDAVALSGGAIYEVETGRKDGRISDVSFAADMPEVSESIQQLKTKFLDKGLSVKDLVLLSAAHTIGTTACFFMTDRLYNFAARGGSDPTINPSFLHDLTARCPKNGDVNVRLAMDRGSEFKFDNQILRNIRTGFAVLESDAKLYTDKETKAVVDSYLSSVGEPHFESDFAASMVNMGRLGVRSGSKGEVRKVCRAFN